MGTGVSAVFRNVISSSLIIQGTPIKLMTSLPCYQYPRPADHWTGDCEGFNSEFMNAAKPPSERNPEINAYRAGLPGDPKAHGEGGRGWGSGPGERAFRSTGKHGIGHSTARLHLLWAARGCSRLLCTPGLERLYWPCSALFLLL